MIVWYGAPEEHGTEDERRHLRVICTVDRMAVGWARDEEDGQKKWKGGKADTGSETVGLM